ncbi:class I glutamine amidotransferase-like protein [Flagelloscypha sp. PMI_526]|nr:class I glutamine amidotransferase-like protein [Flagelloscypha sp. PMI_526]
MEVGTKFRPIQVVTNYYPWNHSVSCADSLLLCLLPNLILARSTAATPLVLWPLLDSGMIPIPTAINQLKAGQASIDAVLDATEDKGTFTDDNLSLYDGVIMLMNTGEVLDDTGKSALQKYLNNGKSPCGNFVAIHSASDALINDEFYGKEVGAYFSYHPVLQNATVNVLDSNHPATISLPKRWLVQDEMYNFKSDPRAVGAVVLLSADGSTYNDNNATAQALQGTPHPTAWYQEHGAGSQGVSGRSFYTSLGHLNETWMNATFMSHIYGGISWVLDSNTTKAANSSAIVGHGSSNTSS